MRKPDRYIEESAEEDHCVTGGCDSRSRADAEVSDAESEENLDFSCGGKLPPNHPDADIIDDLDL